nr:BT4734/BF3469 family protein [uncultured Pontibacter sp.]
MLTWLTSAQHAARVEQIRNLESKEKRLELKAALPGITPSGVFSFRNENCLIRHSGLVQLDIDLKENGHIENYNQLKEEISKIPNVAYCGHSVSGTGFWCLIPIAFPDKHREHILALIEAFDKIYHIKVDPAPSNVASLRGYSYDPDAYFNHRAIPVEVYYEPQRPNFKLVQPEGSRDRAAAEVYIREIEERKIDITGGYHNWLAIGFSLAATFGEGGREYFHRVSQFHPEYHPGRTDRQYSNCLKHGNGKINFGTFIHHCQLAGMKVPENKRAQHAQQSPHSQAASKQNMPEKQGTRAFNHGVRTS